MSLSKWVKACFIGGSTITEPEVPAARPGCAHGPCHTSATGASCVQQQALRSFNPDTTGEKFRSAGFSKDAAKLPQYFTVLPQDKLAEKFARAASRQGTCDHGYNDAVVYYSDLDLPYPHLSSSPRVGLNALRSSNTLGTSSDFLSGSSAFPITHPLRTRTTTGLETGLDQPGAPRWRSSGTGVFDSESFATGEDAPTPILVSSESMTTTASTPAAPHRCNTAPVSISAADPISVVDELSRYLIGLPKIHAPNPQRFRRTITEPGIRLEAVSPSAQDCDQYFRAGMSNKNVDRGCFMMHNSEPNLLCRQTPSLCTAAPADVDNGEIHLLPLRLANYSRSSTPQSCLPMLTTPFAGAAALPIADPIDGPSVSSLSQSLAATAHSSMSLSLWGARGGCQHAPSAALSCASSTAAPALGTSIDVFSDNPDLAGLWGSEVSSVSPTELLL